MVRFHEAQACALVVGFGWWILGVLAALANMQRLDEPLLLVLIAYPIGVVVGCLFWAFVFRGIGWLCVRGWRFSVKLVNKHIRDV